MREAVPNRLLLLLLLVLLIARAGLERVDQARSELAAEAVGVVRGNECVLRRE